MPFVEIRDAVLLVLMFVVFGVPALALGARLAIRPVVEAIVRLREATGSGRALPVDDERFSRLEAEVGRLADEVRRLSESTAFERELAKSSADRLPGAGAASTTA